MGRGERTVSKNNSKGQVWKRNVKSSDSDEDYMLEEDEPADQSDELVSLVGDASDEEILGSFVEEEEENVRKTVRQKSRKRSVGRTENGISISKRRKRIASDDEDDEDYDYNEEEDNGADVQKFHKRSIGRRKNGIKSSEKRKMIASDEEDDYDEEDNDADVKKFRNRSIGRRKNGIKSSEKRKMIASDEEDDEDYDYVEDNDADVKKILNRSIGRRKNGIISSEKRKMIATDEEDDEDYDYVEDSDADLKKYRKRTIGRRKNGIRSSKKGERTAWDEEDDEDYDYVERDEDNDAGVERSCKKSRGRRKNVIKSSKKRETIAAHDEEDDDDCDYEEEGNDANVEKSCKKSSGRSINGIKSSKKRAKIATYDEEDEDDYDYEEEEEEEEELEEDNDAGVERFCEKSTGRRKNGIKSSKKRETIATYDEDEDDYDYEEEEEDNDADVERSCEKSTWQRKKRSKSSKKTEAIAAYDAEGDEDYDYEEEDNDANADADVDSIDGDGGGDDEDEDEDDEDEYDGDECEEDDDDEFALEELDFVDEEEEHPSPKGKKGQSYLKKKGIVRSRKRKTGANLRRHGSNMPASGRSRKSTKKVLSSRGRCKSRSIHRKKKAKPCSDSDFVSSEPSEYVFTTSEEEREQVREANEFCRRSSSNLRSSKQDEQDAASKQPKRKGKEKVDAIQSDVGKQVCGVCLTEEGKNTTRGTLDCCSHFFCFACIMEWSKVESRCPLCKQRFSEIRKPARSAARIDMRNEVIHVPERDQVYQPSEEELRNYLDPYENVLCTECQEGGDDALMLLCDICDSPAHTYCVGLGREVPEGNWYCEGCRPSALGSALSQAQDLTPDQRLHSSSVSEPSFENMAEIDLNITIPETPMTPVNGVLVSPRQSSGGSLQAPAPVSGVGVSTLSGRRRVHLFQYYNNISPRGSGPGRTDFSGLSENRAAQSSYLESGTPDVGTSYHAEYINRLQVLSNTAQNRERFPRRPSLLRGQAPQAAPPPVDSSANGCAQLGGVGGINLERNYAPGCEWLQPCASRLNSTSQTSASPSYNRDVDQNIVKQQIQSLVKSQLKNIGRELNLGYDAYKQIARSSTHTILAECGLEHSMREVHEIRPPICLHYEALVGPQMSLIKGCCQACFDSFVRDVVRTIAEVKAKAPEQLSFRNY